MENLSKTTNAPKMGMLLFQWGGNVADTEKHDGHAKSGMFIVCGERDTLQMPKRASAMYLKGGRWGRGEVWGRRGPKKHVADALLGVCYVSKRWERPPNTKTRLNRRVFDVQRRGILLWKKQKLLNIIKMLKNDRRTLYAPALCPLRAPLPSLAPSALSLVTSGAFSTCCGWFVPLVRHDDVASWRACVGHRSRVSTCREGGGEGAKVREAGNAKGGQQWWWWRALMMFDAGWLTCEVSRDLTWWAEQNT